MLVGTAGTGKSVLMGATLSSLNPEEYLVKNVPFNYYTTSAMLQGKGPERVLAGSRGKMASLRGHATLHGAEQSVRYLLGWTVHFSYHPLLASYSFLLHNTSAPWQVDLDAESGMLNCLHVFEITHFNHAEKYRK